MTFDTLTLKLFTTFSSMSFGNSVDSKLVEDMMWDVLDASVYCESRVMNLRDKCLSYPLHIPREPGGELRHAVALVVVNNTACLPNFPHEKCDNVPMGESSGYFVETTSGHSW